MYFSSPPPDSGTANKNATRFLWFLFVAGGLVLALLSEVDQTWTLWWHEHGNRLWGEIMYRSIFRGEGFGGSDPAGIVWLVSLFFYAWSWKKSFPQNWSRYRPALGFLMLTPLVGMITVHSLKWGIGRARPYEVWDNKFPYTDWYEFGAHYISEGMYSGSFPSGHTASVVMLLTLVYAAMGHLKKPAGFGKLWLSGSIIILWAVGMALGRAVTGAHWLTDSLGCILPLWALVHALYFHILKIPQQEAYQQIHGAFPKFPFLWELRFAIHGFISVFGCLEIVWWVRSLRIEPQPIFAVILIPGLFFATYFGLRLFVLHEQTMATLFETST